MLRLDFRAATTDSERLDAALLSGSGTPVSDVRALSRSCSRSLICTKHQMSPAADYEQRLLMVRCAQYGACG